MLPARGRPGAVLLMTIERALRAQDIERLAMQTQELPKVAMPMVKRLRTAHHEAARLIIQGHSAREVALVVGYTPQRVSDLQTKDPAFIELLAYYRNQMDDIAIDAANRMQKKLVDIAELASDELQERLEDDVKRAAMPTSEIRQILDSTLDRSIAPHRTAQVTQTPPVRITFNMGNRDIKPASEKAQEDSKVYDHERLPD